MRQEYYGDKTTWPLLSIKVRGVTPTIVPLTPRTPYQTTHPDLGAQLKHKISIELTQF